MSAPCIACASPTKVFYPAVKDHLFGLAGSFCIVRCMNSRCGHGQLDPLPTPAELSVYYSKYITHEAANVDDNPRQDPLSRYLKSRAAHIARRYIFLNDLAPENVLEIGSGNGVNLLTLKSLGWQVEGQELDPVAAQGAMARGIPVKVGFLSEVESQLSSYRAVIMVHVIEHLADPRTELKIALKHLKAKGRLVIITPNFVSLPRRIFGRFWAPLHVPFHLQHFTRASLETMVRQAGFKLVQNRTHSTHSASNIRASLGFVAQEKAWMRALMKVPGLTKILEVALFFALLFWEKVAPGLGDECVLIAEPAS